MPIKQKLLLDVALMNFKAQQIFNNVVTKKTKIKLEFNKRFHNRNKDVYIHKNKNKSLAFATTVVKFNSCW